MSNHGYKCPNIWWKNAAFFELAPFIASVRRRRLYILKANKISYKMVFTSLAWDHPVQQAGWSKCNLWVIFWLLPKCPPPAPLDQAWNENWENGSKSLHIWDTDLLDLFARATLYLGRLSYGKTDFFGIVDDVASTSVQNRENRFWCLYVFSWITLDRRKISARK